MGNVKIVDARMGKGKTSWAIQQIIGDVDRKYVYITPFLSEVRRVRENCSERKFKEPINTGNGKQGSLHELLMHGHNIVSTHALFRASTDVTRDLIACNDYVLILDEVMDVIEQIPLRKDDIPSMLELKLITILDDGLVVWNEEKDDYDGKYNEIRIMAQNKTLIIVNGVMMMWNFPIEVFKSFKEVYILTYMFDAQIQRYYYDLFGLEYEYFTVVKNDSKYDLVEIVTKEELLLHNKPDDIRDLIEICDNEKLNAVGRNNTALSSTWFSRTENKELCNMLKNNIYNYFRHFSKAKSTDLIWTTFKAASSKLKGPGNSRGFIACNIRATNEYGNRHCMAYCLNVFLNPIVYHYFENKGVSVDEDGYALSEMLQWIWRSAIRNGEKVYIYIPSSRMRGLLIDYLYGSFPSTTWQNQNQTH